MFKTRSLGKIFGVELKIHSTFLLLMAYLAISGVLRGGVGAGLISLTLALVVFSVVVLHELGHIFAARYYGIGTKDIILSPIGGVARLVRLPKKPSQEMVVAAAGPAVNLVLGGLSWLALTSLPWAQFGAYGPLGADLMNWFMMTNAVLLGFNLLPALPMDGGRILRAALSKKRGHLRATQISAKVARWTALGIALTGLYFGQYTMVLVAAFVFIMSWVELGQAYMRAGVPQQQQQQASVPRYEHAPGQVVVDQYGNPVGGGSTWDAPGAAPSGWSVRSVRWVK